MEDYVCDNPGTFECMLLGILYDLILGPLGDLLALFGYQLTWDIEPAER